MTITTLSVPTSDFATTSLDGAIDSDDESAVIGISIDIPAANGVLSIDYDSTEAIGDPSGPEIITYTAYNSETGALTGITRGAAGTQGVSHENGASVQCSPSSLYFNNLSDIIGNSAWSGWSPTYAGFSADPTQTCRYKQIGKLVFAEAGSLNYFGTSNATSFTMTLPIAPKYAFKFNCPCADDSAPTAYAARGDVDATGKITFYKDGAGTGWTNSGTKGVSFSICYEAA